MLISGGQRGRIKGVCTVCGAPTAFYTCEHCKAFHKAEKAHRYKKTAKGRGQSKVWKRAYYYRNREALLRQKKLERLGYA